MTNLKYFLAIVIISFLGVVFETTVINFPIVFLIASVLLLFVKKIQSYIGIFILGFIIDAVRVTNFGMTPLFLFGSALCILLYEKYSGSKDLVVAAVILGAMAFAYVYFLSYSLSLLIMFFALVILTTILLNILKKRGILFG